MKKVYCCLLVGALAGLASAGPSALYLMPIADILAHREAFVYIGFQGNERNVDRSYAKFNALTVGLFDRVEVGIDNDFMGHNTANIKLQLFESPASLPGAALSVGVMNWTGNHVDPYVVGRYDLKGVRLHAGLWRLDNVVHAMYGADFPVPGTGTGSIEFMSGPSSITWLSGYWDIPQLEGLGIMLSVGVPSARVEGIQHAATVVYSFKF